MILAGVRLQDIHAVAAGPRLAANNIKVVIQPSRLVQNPFCARLSSLLRNEEPGYFAVFESFVYRIAANWTF
jgi:hypothetical protein